MRIGNVVAHALAQAVVVVAPVVDRQEAAVLGVENEEEPIEENKSRSTGGGEIVAQIRIWISTTRKGTDQSGKHALEHYL